jgi:dTDP-4-dehydrorhamnose 3,5-epimerase
MKFLPTALPDVWLIELEPRADDRGFLARTYCEREFGERGLNTHWPQMNLTRTLERGMIRGLHYQADPKPETKLIRCSAGAIFDVVVDVRRGSPNYGRWASFELSGEGGRQLYVPGGFAHGFQCREDRSEVLYLMSDFYDSDLARGVRWDDPALGIPWPIPDPSLSERDRQLPPLGVARGASPAD